MTDASVVRAVLSAGSAAFRASVVVAAVLCAEFGFVDGNVSAAGIGALMLTAVFAVWRAFGRAVGNGARVVLAKVRRVLLAFGAAIRLIQPALAAVVFAAFPSCPAGFLALCGGTRVFRAECRVPLSGISAPCRHTLQHDGHDTAVILAAVASSEPWKIASALGALVLIAVSPVRNVGASALGALARMLVAQPLQGRVVPAPPHDGLMAASHGSTTGMLTKKIYRPRACL